MLSLELLLGLLLITLVGYIIFVKNNFKKWMAKIDEM